MRHLCDSNVFVALTLKNHPHHREAVRWMEGLDEGETASFCRATQQSYLRLLTTSVIVKSETRSNDEALEAWQKLSTDARVELVANEPAGLEERWLDLAQNSSPAPKRWMDAYLASFAICERMRFVTFDQGFAQYRAQGLDLLLLEKTTR